MRKNYTYIYSDKTRLKAVCPLILTEGTTKDRLQEEVIKSRRNKHDVRSNEIGKHSGKHKQESAV